MYSNNTNLSLCQWQKLHRFQPKMHQKHLAEPRPAGGAYSAPPDILVGFNSGAGTKGEGRRKDRRVWTAEGGLEDRKERRGGRGGGMEKRGWEGEEKSHPTVISKSRRLWSAHGHYFRMSLVWIIKKCSKYEIISYKIVVQTMIFYHKWML